MHDCPECQIGIQEGKRQMLDGGFFVVGSASGELSQRYKSHSLHSFL